jgi:hypothetical protein
MLRYLIERIDSLCRAVVYKYRLEHKWINDSRHLPLTREHRELYDIIHQLCWIELGEFPDLIHCRDFNDRIQWLKLFDQDYEIIRCSDKVLVRDYVRERLGDKYLTKMYQVHDHFDQISFDLLPDSFVIKTNHDSGTVVLVRNKMSFDLVSAKERIEKALKRPFGWKNGEWAYSYIKPKVLVEEYIEPNSPTPPPDYKFYCVEGKVKFCHYIYDRGSKTKEQTIDLDGVDMKTDLYSGFKYGDAFIKPGNWNEMISVAEQIGRGFKYVRVDMFSIGDRIVVGEMTFWPMAGFYKSEGQKTIGSLLDFDRTTHKPPIIPTLEKVIGAQDCG